MVFFFMYPVTKQMLTLFLGNIDYIPLCVGPYFVPRTCWPQPQSIIVYYPILPPLLTESHCLLQVDLNQSAETIHNFIRGCDKVPGAWIEINGEVDKIWNLESCLFLLSLLWTTMKIFQRVCVLEWELVIFFIYR